MDWDVALSGGQLYLTTHAQTLSGEIRRGPLLEA